MDLLIILTYTAFCIAVFKIFRIPKNKWTVPTAILGGIVILSSLLLLMNYNHPFTKMGKQFFVTVPIVPEVKGIVLDVQVTANTPLQQGDILFSIQPKPYENKVQQKKATLAAAQEEVKQLKASWQAAVAQTRQAKADRDRTYNVWQRYSEGVKKGGRNAPFSALELDNRKQLYLGAKAKYEAAQSQQKRANLAYRSPIDGINTKVALRQAELAQAEYDLARTVVYAPSDGFVTQLRLRKGMMAVPIPLRPVMTFVPTGEKGYFAAAFWQNSLKRLQPGYAAEVILDALPGRVLKGKVHSILPSIGEGELQAEGVLARTNRFSPRGRTIVLIALEEDLSALGLPIGVSGQVAVYSDHFHHVAIMRKILLRMVSWQNYLFGEGH